jgi:hypothetical protein
MRKRDSVLDMCAKEHDAMTENEYPQMFDDG